MHSFGVHEEDGRYIIRSDHSDEFIVRAEPDTDAAAAQRMGDAMNAGYRMGYSVGEADAQQTMRRALGLE